MDTYPKGSHLILLSKYLKCSVDWLLKVDGPEVVEEILGVRQATGETAAEQGKPSAVDPAMLSAVIEAVEEHLISRKRKLTPPRKARLISLLYGLFVESGEPVSQEKIVACLRLVA